MLTETSDQDQEAVPNIQPTSTLNRTPRAFKSRHARTRVITSDGRWSTHVDSFCGKGLPFGENRKEKYILKLSSALVSNRNAWQTAALHRRCGLTSGSKLPIAVALPTLDKDLPLRKKFKRTLTRPLSFAERLLSKCVSDEELVKRFLEGVVGWLNLYQVGVLHRNVSLSNIRFGKKNECATTSFKLNIPKPLSNPGGRSMTEIIGHLLPNERHYLKDFQPNENVTVERWANEIEGLLKQAGLDTGLSTYICEDGYNLQWEKMLDRSYEAYDDSGHGFGMYQSGQLCRQKMMMKKMKKGHKDKDFDGYKYIQNPIDDLKAFMYTFMYALIFRRSTYSSRSCRSSSEVDWQAEVIDGCKDEESRSSLRHKIAHNLHRRIQPNPFEVDKLFWEWRLLLNKIRMDCRRVEEDYKRHLKRSEKLQFWHLWAYRGVHDILQSYVRHKQRISKRDSGIYIDEVVG